MRKQEFLAQLRKGLSGLPQEDIDERLTFYCEMIEDRMEEGLSEEEAVLAIGSVDEIVAQISLVKIAKEESKPKRLLKAWEIVLFVLGSPIWLSLGIAVFAVTLSLYVSLWSMVFSLWAVFASLAACSVGCVVAGVGFAIGGNCLTGIATVGAGIVCAGLSIFMFYGCKAAMKGLWVLTTKIAIWLKNCFMKKEDA